MQGEWSGCGVEGGEEEICGVAFGVAGAGGGELLGPGVAFLPCVAGFVEASFSPEECGEG